MKDYSLIGVFKTLHKWRKPVVYGTAAVFVLSVIVSLLLPVYYSSTTVFYAASEDIYKPKKVLGYSDTDIRYFGSSEDILRVLTLATSHDLTNHIVSTFDLYDHYKINPDKPRAAYLVREKFLSHYDVIRTKYDAIELTVEDRDPEIAAAIANAARDKIESMIEDIIRSSQQKVIESYEEIVETKEGTLVKLYDSLNVYQSEYGILDPMAQTEFLSTLMTSLETSLAGQKAKLASLKESQIKGVRDSIAMLESDIAASVEQLRLLKSGDSTETSNYNIQRFIQAKGKVTLLEDAYLKGLNTVNLDKEMLKQLRSAYNLDVPSLHVVEYAQIPMIKSRPKRSLLILGCTAAAFFFLVIGVLFLDSYKTEDWSFLRKW